MKKITFVFVVLTIFFSSIVHAGVVTSDLYKFEFNGVATSVIPSTPAITATLVGGTSTAVSLFQVVNGSCALNVGANVLFSGGGSGGRGSAAFNLNNNTNLPTNKKVVVEFIWNPNTTNGDAMAYNAIGLSDFARNPIFVFVVERWGTTNSGIHLMNLTPEKLSTTWLLNSPVYSGGGDYRIDCTTDFAGSLLGVDFVNNQTYNVKAKLDFATDKIDSLWVTRVDDNSKVYIGTNINFLSAAATNADRISAVATRGRNLTNTGNGGNSHLWMTIDNYHVYTWEVATIANVSVNYYDADDNSLIKTVIRENQAAGGIYTATGFDKASFTQNGNYYVFSSTTVDNVTVTQDGLASISILMKRFPVSNQAFTWTGNVDGNWNELTTNFTDGVNNLGYQPGNSVIFPETAQNKAIIVNENFNLGEGDLVISGEGYNIGGSATLTGTGKLDIQLTGDKTLSLNVTSNLTGISNIAGGVITLAKSGVLGSGAIVSGPATLITGANGIVIPTTTFNASTIINAGTSSNTLLNGLTIPAGVKVSVNTAFDHASTSATGIDIAANGILSAGSGLEVIGAGADNRVGLTSASANYLANTHLMLKGNAMFYLNVNQSAASTINIGTLSGDSGTKLGWGRSTALERNITWSVGALNENSEFAGSITNMGGYNAAGSSFVGNLTNFVKVGTGTLTMSGAANLHNGSFMVNGGTLHVTGAVANAASATIVAAEGTLSGTGTVGGPATINGTLKGRLNFAGALTLAGTTELTVAGFESATFDKINVAGNLTRGGNLNVNITALPPAVGTKIKLIDAVSSTGSFAGVSVPAGYSFDESTGELTRDFGSSLSETAGFRIYPTRVSNEVIVEGQGIVRISLYNISGQMVKAISSVNERNIISMNQLTNGAYLLKVGFADGSVKVQNILLQK